MRIARHLGKDPLDIRKRNLYGKADRNVDALSHDGRGQHPAGADRRSSNRAPTTGAAAPSVATTMQRMPI